MTTQPNRRCGDCGVCCDVLAVPDFKPANTRCKHMSACGTNRCRIHASPEKPSVCSTYQCMWLMGHFQTGDRPDKLGVFFDAHEVDGYYLVVARETRSGNAKAGNAARLIEKMSHGMLVVVVPPDDGPRRLVCNNRAIAQKLQPKLRQLGLA